MPDVTVVGGGPAGSFSARLMAASGRDVLLLEDHHCSGLPVHCAGVVSGEALKNFGVRPTVQGTISAADVVLPDGSIIPTSKRMPYAYVVNRAELDQKMMDLAESAGAIIRYGVRYKTFNRTTDNISIDTNVGKFTSDLLVGADGQSSLVAAALGSNHAKSYLKGIQYDIKYRMDDERKMILRLGNEVAPGFFAWQLPLGDITRIGLAIRVDPEITDTPVKYLDKLLKNQGLDGKERLATYVGKIPLGGRRTSYADRVLLIGDAAGQVKPVSGGGLYPISKAAPVLKEAVDRAYEMNNFTSNVLALYERGWKREIWNSISHGMKLRKYYDRLDDDDLNELGHMFARPEVAEQLCNIDIDDPGNVVKPILKIKGVKSQLVKTYLKAVL